ncbi:MAG TPA: ankyrin repeat domain-containing protein [Vicinamibacterales bacterium]|nr:ankyrin repeat domain-containing protein [Vicinamibacterales bacterium]
MNRSRALKMLAGLCVLIVALAHRASGQMAGPVIGIGDLPHGVANIEQAVDFYRETLGLELISLVPDSVGGKPAPSVYDARRQALMNVGGAYYRVATFQLPNSTMRMQLVEMINNDPLSALKGRRQTSALPTEAGGLLLRLPAQDLDGLSARIRDRFAADVATLGAKPVGDRVRRLSFRDGEDGFLIESVQQSASTEAPGIVLVAANLERKLRFYHDLLGFDIQAGEWENDRAALTAAGAETGGIRRHTAKVPGTNVPFEIVEYRGFHQRRFFSPIMGQAGVGWIQLKVRDVDALMKRFIDNRVRIVSTGLRPVDLDDSRRVVVRDPDGVYLELIEARSRIANPSATSPSPRPRVVETNAQHTDGMTPLHWAVYREDEREVRTLLAAGANPGAVTRYGVTPLGLAAENRNSAIAATLLAHGADPDAQTSGETALHVAARTGALEIARALLSHRAKVDSRDNWQSVTPLMVAAAENHADLVAAFIAAHANVNAKAAETSLFIGPGDESTTYTQIPRGGMTPLMFAARSGCEPCVTSLVEAGANVNDEDRARVTPLNLAIVNGHYDTAARLIELGANPNDGSVYLVVDMRNLVADGVNADHHPVPRTNDRLGPVDILARLLARGANPDHELLKEVQGRSLGFNRPVYLTGLTPLGRAAQQADLESMRVLLDYGAAPSLATEVIVGNGSSGGETPLIYATRSFAGVPASGLGNRPGKLAYRSRQPGDSVAAVNMLLDAGADVTAADWAGNTAVHVAALVGAPDVIQVLAASGANIDVKNEANQTALDLVTSPPAARGGGRRAAAPNPGTAAAAELLRKLTESRR